MSRDDGPSVPFRGLRVRHSDQIGRADGAVVAVHVSRSEVALGIHGAQKARGKSFGIGGRGDLEAYRGLCVPKLQDQRLWILPRA